MGTNFNLVIIVTRAFAHFVHHTIGDFHSNPGAEYVISTFLLFIIIIIIIRDLKIRQTIQV